jgi:hypothetical protein
LPAVVIDILRGQRRCRSGQQLPHLRVLAAHDLRRPAGRCRLLCSKSGKRTDSSAAEVVQHAIAKARKGCSGEFPPAVRQRVLDGGEQFIAGAMINGHEIGDGLHGKPRWDRCADCPAVIGRHG